MSNNNVVTSPYYIEDFYIDPIKNIIVKNDKSVNIQPKVMTVLTYFCMNVEQLISTEELINTCWFNQYISDSPIHKCIAQIRKLLNDNPKKPQFIKTIPKKGYIFIATVRGIHQIERFPSSIKNTTHWIGNCPYPGLQPYQFSDSEIFFGREQVIEDINNWLCKIGKRETSWLSLSAPSKCGKTSLVYAGILPKLLSHKVINTAKKNFYCVLDLANLSARREQNERPDKALLTLLIQHQNLPEKTSFTNYCHLSANELKKSNSSNDYDEGRLVIFIDHLEYLFDEFNRYRPSQYALDRFFTLLKNIVVSKNHLLITTICEQYLNRLNTNISFYELAFHYEIPEFSRTELTDIIEKPAQITGVSFEYDNIKREQLNKVIISELEQEFHHNHLTISVVQLMLSRLYKQKSNLLITFKAYNKLGGVLAYLAIIAEQSYSQLTNHEQKCFRTLLFHLVSLKDDNHKVTSKRLCSVDCFNNHEQLHVINKLINSGVIQLSVIHQKTFISLNHNYLLSHWHVISTWIDKNIKQLYLRYDLKIATQRWIYHKKSEHLLIHSNKKLKSFKRLIQSDIFLIKDEEKDLLYQSHQHVKEGLRAKNSLKAGIAISFISLIILTLSLYKKNQQLDQSRSNAENLISFIIYDLKDKLAPLEKLELLDLVASKTNKYFQQAGTEHLTGTSLLQWVEALHTLGEVNINKSNYRLAESYFHQSLQVLDKQLNILQHNNAHKSTRQVSKTTVIPDYQRNKFKVINKQRYQEKLLALIMLNNYWLGYSAYLQQDYKKAEPLLNNYLAYTEYLIKLYPKAKWQLEKSYALNNLGSLAEKQQQFTLASGYFAQSAKIKSDLITTQANNVNLIVGLANTLSWQSNIQAASGKLLKAIKYLKQALLHLKGGIDIKDNYRYLAELSIVEHKLALTYYDLGNIAQAMIHTENNEKALNKLISNDPENNVYKKDLLWCYLLKSQIYINQHQLDLALIYTEKSTELINNMTNQTTLTEIIKATIYLYQQQARIMALLKQQQSAKISINKALAIFKKHFSYDSDLTLYAELLLSKASIASRSNSQSKTETSEKLIDIQQKILNKFNNSEKPSYQVMAIYLHISTFLKQSALNNAWLQQYRDSDYNIPDDSSVNN